MISSFPFFFSFFLFFNWNPIQFLSKLVVNRDYIQLPESRSPVAIMKHFNFFEGTSTGCDTIIRMLNEDDKKVKDEMTKNWRNHKLEELKFVGTLVCSIWLVIVFLPFANSCRALFSPAVSAQRVHGRMFYQMASLNHGW